MKNKGAANRAMRAASVPIIITLIFASAFPVLAKSYTAGEVQSFADGIISYNLNEDRAETAQDWINGALAEGAGADSEWYVMALGRMGQSYDFSPYTSALASFLEKTRTAGATARQKYALAFLAAGGGGEAGIAYTKAALGDSVGKQGIMSLIYGLLLINNTGGGGPSADETVAALLGLRLDDGGWALTGELSDVDVTAVALQALAPYCASGKEAGEAVEGALALLSEKQLDGGGFSSYGAENPESAAQVIIALSSLGIDCASDGRFIKNGASPLDNMLAFRLPDGSFSHTAGGKTNRTATIQALCAFIAYQRFLEGGTPFYDFSDICSFPSETGTGTGTGTAAVGDTAPETSAAAAETAVLTPESAGAVTSTPAPAASAPSVCGVSYKVWAAAAVAALAVIISLILILAGKRNIKNFIFVFAAAAVITAVVTLTDFKTPGQYYNSEIPRKENAVGTVTMTIRCDTVAGKAGEVAGKAGEAAGKSNKDYIPADGIILAETEFEITDGESVYDILIEAARRFNIQLENEGSALGADGMAYISGINYIYEFDFGDLSGWVYRVNGKTSPVNCADYTLSPGDKIEWLYTLDLGNDLD